MSRESELQARFNKLRKDHLELEKRFKGLVDALYDAEVLFGVVHKYEFFNAGVNILTMQAESDECLKLILDHLGLEFELVKCRDHYELRKKEEKK